MEAGVWDLAGIPVEAGAVSVSPNNSDTDTSDFTSVQYTAEFAEACLTVAPVTLATILVPSFSMKDEEPLVVRMSKNTAAGGFDLGLQGNEMGKASGDRQVNYIAVGASNLDSSLASTGYVSVTHEVTSIALPESNGDICFFAQISTWNGRHTAELRTTLAHEEDEVQVFIEEAQGKDNSHPAHVAE